MNRNFCFRLARWGAAAVLASLLPFAACTTPSDDGPVTTTTTTTITSSSSTDTTSTGDPVATACTAVAEARCDKRRSCTDVFFPEGLNILRNFGALATCVARETLACTEALAAPDTGQSVAQVEACTTAVSAQTCGDFLGKSPPSACTPAGSRNNGEACAFNAQCTTGFCANTKNAICGTCAAMPAAGASCATSNCGRDLVCVNSTELCQAPVALGGSCGAGFPCASGLDCAAGTCVAALTTEGAACGGALPGCEGSIGLACTGAPGAKTCTKVSLAASAAECGALVDGSHGVCTAGDCYTATGPATGNDTGTCEASAADGAPCDTLLGPECLAPARCVTAGGTTGTCVVPTADSCI